MINSILIHAPETSYKEPVEITGLKKFNLFYGINGAGKTVLSQYLEKFNNPGTEYIGSQINYDIEPDIFVYNQDFIQENFWNNKYLRGIFTLGKSNVEAETAIEQARLEIEKLLGNDEENAYSINKKSCENKRKTLEHKQLQLKKELENTIWACKIKYENTQFSRFMKGLMGSKDKFCDYITDIEYHHKDHELPNNKRLERLEKELNQLNTHNSEKKESVETLSNNLFDYESDPIFGKSIVGSQNSYLKDLIEELNNEDWLIQGISNYLNKSRNCPFCTQPIQNELREKLNSHIDSTYQRNIERLEAIQQAYVKEKNETEKLLNDLKHITSFADNNEFIALTEELTTRLENNLILITNKIKEPSQTVNLHDNARLIEQINNIISFENENIRILNEKITNKERSIEEIKIKFWQLIRENYEPAISAYHQHKKDIEQDIEQNDRDLKKISNQINTKNELINEKQKETKNIEEAVNNINKQLKNFGIESFSIKKYNENQDNDPLYFISREGKNEDQNPFHTLSEGEKTLITFLYFVERTNGLEDTQEVKELKNRVIVIDDPISSLSFNFIFDIAVLIKEKYLHKNTKFSQIFILTHHLYFLHELFGNTRDELPKDFSLHRIIKGSHSIIKPIKRSEIKNNYECYWQVIKDVKAGTANPIVLPNAMRNILEHYFSFIHSKHKLIELIDELAESEKELSFKSFHRYVDRSSHSDAVNIVDSNDIDVDKYLAYFEKIFVKAGFMEHFNAMSNNGTYDV
ncbi:AAA family ATPase [Legionella pneumophila serogroup 1]